MAVIKHIASKNANYEAAIDYLMYKHDELSGKMIRDENGNPIVRDDFLMDGINCEPFEYPIAAMETNRLYGKNGAKGDVKSHHYVLSFDPRDEDVGLTFDEAHRMALKFSNEWFGAYQGIVFTHPEGHNESGNIHCHIVFCSVRVKDEPIRDWMTHRSEWEAGGKHHTTLECHAELKQAVMDMCRKRNLHQVDLLSPAKERVTEREYWAQRRLEIQEKLDAEQRANSEPDEAAHDDGNRDENHEHRDENERGSEHETNRGAGAQQRESGENEASRERSERKEPPSRYTTQKQQLRRAIRDASSRATDFESFAAILKNDHGIEAKMTRGRITYKHPEREKNIRGRSLGVDYEWPIIEAAIKHRLEHGKAPARQSLVSQIDDAMKSKGTAYVNKVQRSNVRKLSESIAFLQEAGFSSREELDAAVELSSEALEAAETSLSATESALSRTNKAIRASGAYLSNRGVWRAYRASPDRRAFYMAHKRELEACNGARRELKKLFPDGKPPTLSELKAEKQRLIAERNAKYDAWTTERYRHRELETAKRNVDAILGDGPGRGKSRATHRNDGMLE